MTTQSSLKGHVLNVLPLMRTHCMEMEGRIASAVATPREVIAPPT